MRMTGKAQKYIMRQSAIEELGRQTPASVQTALQRNPWRLKGIAERKIDTPRGLKPHGFSGYAHGNPSR